MRIKLKVKNSDGDTVFKADKPNLTMLLEEIGRLRRIGNIILKEQQECVGCGQKLKDGNIEHLTDCLVDKSN